VERDVPDDNAQQQSQQQEPPTTGDGTGQQAQNQSQQQNAGGQDSKEPERRFTQAELDAIVRDRLERERQSAERKADADRKKAEEAAAAQRGEYQRLAEERGQKLTELQQQLAERERTSREATVRYEVRVLASDLGFADPSDAPRFLDLAGVEFDDSGAITTDLKALLEAVLKAKPYLGRQPGAGGVPPTPKPDNGALTDEEKRRQAVGIRQLW
jgi:hypothetical protein